MERVYKSFAGYAKETDTKVATHIILTLEEYNVLQANLDELYEKINRIEAETYKKLTQTKIEFDKLHIQNTKNFNTKIAELQANLDTFRSETSRLENLNTNLLRICKERANAKRKITPKKSYQGYLVLDGSQYRYNFKLNGTAILMNCWKIKIQTPFDCFISYNAIKQDLKVTLSQFFIEQFNVADCIDKFSGVHEYDFMSTWNSCDNILFDIHYKQNIRSSFWEVDCFFKSYVEIINKILL